MEPVTITGLERVRDPRVTPNGHTILAYFTAEVGVFSIKGCALARTARGGLAAWLPNLHDAKSKANRSITLHDEPTRNSMLKHAIDMYRTMGGTDAEYAPPDSDEVGEILPTEVLPPPIGRRPIAVKKTITTATRDTKDLRE